MSTLADRLKIALAESGKRKTDLWKACKISSGAVTQWFDGSVQQLESKNLLIVSDLLKVNSTWLATGKGSKELGTSNVAQLQPEKETLQAQAIRLLADMEPDEVDLWCLTIKVAANKARKQKQKESEKAEFKPPDALPLERRRTA